MMATTIIDVAFNMGLRVPEDISIVGFDDSPLAKHGGVPLTSVRQPLVEMGTLSINTLYRIIQGKIKPPIKKLLPTQLIERASCRKTRIEI
jgi:LacI family transcriptional regulator